MISGHVLDLTPRVRLSLSGVMSAISLEFVVDTGYDGDLAILERLFGRLNATFLASIPIELADGTTLRSSRYRVTLEWDGEPRDALAISLRGGTPLIGVGLLAGNVVTLDMIDGGDVMIEPR